MLSLIESNPQITFKELVNYNRPMMQLRKYLIYSEIVSVKLESLSCNCFKRNMEIKIFIFTDPHLCTLIVKTKSAESYLPEINPNKIDDHKHIVQF